MKYFMILALSFSLGAFAEIMQNETETGVVPAERSEEFNKDLKTQEERVEHQKKIEQQRMEDLNEGEDVNLHEEQYHNEMPSNRDTTTPSSTTPSGTVTP